MLTASLLLALTCAAPQDAAPNPDKQLAEVTYLANAGFLIRSGETSLLIDGFVPREVAGMEALSAPVRRLMIKGQAPFDRPLLSLVSHAHPDHFKGAFAQLVLMANPESKLISSKDVLTQLARAGKGWEQISKRVGPFKRTPRQRLVPYTDLEKDLSVTFLDLPHMEGEEKALEHVGHLVRLGNFKLLHLGDSAPDTEALKRYKLAKRNIDLALVPYWFYASQQGIEAIDELIQARFVAVYHMPVPEKAKFVEQLKRDNPNVIVFGQSMERKMFEVEKRK